mmetsp:Transcript_23334/g.58490  ORF Transcript_23334/g.58490 Transcript_23334/m.58490 type:complete len:240 (-) Transcript_23334:102-821(-)
MSYAGAASVGEVTSIESTTETEKTLLEPEGSEGKRRCIRASTASRCAFGSLARRLQIQFATKIAIASLLATNSTRARSAPPLCGRNIASITRTATKVLPAPAGALTCRPKLRATALDRASSYSASFDFWCSVGCSNLHISASNLSAKCVLSIEMSISSVAPSTLTPLVTTLNLSLILAVSFSSNNTESPSRLRYPASLTHSRTSNELSSSSKMPAIGTQCTVLPYPSSSFPKLGSGSTC